MCLGPVPERLRRLAFRGGLATLWIAAAYYLIFGGVYSVFDLRVLETEKQEAMQRLDSLISITDSLVLLGDSLTDDPVAIERVAREYGLVRDGEELYRFHPRDTASRPNPVDEAEGHP